MNYFELKDEIELLVYPVESESQQWKAYYFDFNLILSHPMPI